MLDSLLTTLLICTDVDVDGNGGLDDGGGFRDDDGDFDSGGGGFDDDDEVSSSSDSSGYGDDVNSRDDPSNSSSQTDKQNLLLVLNNADGSIYINNKRNEPSSRLSPFIVAMSFKTFKSPTQMSNPNLAFVCEYTTLLPLFFISE